MGLCKGVVKERFVRLLMQWTDGKCHWFCLTCGKLFLFLSKLALCISNDPDLKQKTNREVLY